MKAQVAKRVTGPTVENMMILMLDPRTKFSVEDLLTNTNNAKPAASTSSVPSSKVATAASGASKTATEAYERKLRQVIKEGHRILRDAHREVFLALYAPSNNHVESANTNQATNFDLVPSVDDDAWVLCDAPVALEALPTAPQSSLHEKADAVLEV